VPKVVGKRLGAAKSAIKQTHCRTGKVGYAYSRKTKGIVISQSRRPGRVVPIADSRKPTIRVDSDSRREVRRTT
jgi:beta-lactam-binding protein with PASTA domain